MSKKSKRKNRKRKKDHSTDDLPQQKKPDTSEQKKESIAKTKSDQEDPDSGSINNNASSTSIGAVNNPLLQRQQAFLNSLTVNERNNFFSNDLLDAERRAEIWMDQADVGEELINEYSWAIPNQRALRILKHFSPIVEIGCGSNAYWCKVMKKAGIDVIGYDQYPEVGGKISKNDATAGENSNFHVRKGGPEVLATKKLIDSNRTLFLCYTDEEDDAPSDKDKLDDDDEEQEQPLSVAAKCLRYYEGTYIVHVGELYGDTTSMDQAPWGRSSSPEFQQQLAAQYHCLLRVSLPNYLHVRDTISVWKRTETCSIVFAAEEDDDDEGDTEVEYKHIPVKERLPTDMAAPCLQHLLSQDEIDDNAITSSKPENSSSTEEKENLSKSSDDPMEEKETDKQISTPEQDSSIKEKKKSSKKKSKKKKETNNAEYVCPW